jgi:hypothetical protein
MPDMEAPVPPAPDPVLPVEELELSVLLLAAIVVAAYQASKALPRTDGSRTISCMLSSTFPPPGIGRLTLTVTFHRFGAEFCSQSSDHCHWGSSSRGVSPWDCMAMVPAASSASLDWPICTAWLRSLASSA